jgi:hypothetical protein
MVERISKTKVATTAAAFVADAFGAGVGRGGLIPPAISPRR